MQRSYAFKSHWILLCLFLALALWAGARSLVRAQDAADGTILYVDADATGAATGESWSDAFVTLQDALVAVNAGDQIWVAEGIYYPDEGGAAIDNDRTATFNLPAGVTLYGGFAPDASAGELTTRDHEKHLTILSGNIDRLATVDASGIVTGALESPSLGSHHILTVVGAATRDETPVTLDGFHVTGGKGESSNDVLHSFGSALFCDGHDGLFCNPNILNTHFVGNHAPESGGAIYLYGVSGEASPLFLNVTFSQNHGMYGGAVFAEGQSGVSSPSFTNVTFDGNTARAGGGGAVYASGSHGDSSPVFVNVQFINNSATSGGALGIIGRDGKSNPSITNASFVGNHASSGGGAVFAMSMDGESKPAFYNVEFRGNSAEEEGGAFLGNYQVQGSFINNTFAGNSAAKGGALRITESNPGPVISNSILWGNASTGTGVNISTVNSGVIASQSIIEPVSASVWDEDENANPWGTTILTGVSNDDPLFVKGIAIADAPTIDGDLRLQEGSPAVNAGDNNLLPATVTTDLDNNPRIVDGVIDLGAFEFGAPVDSSTSYDPVASVTLPVSGTLLSLQSVNFPDRYVRHSGMQGFIQPIGGDLDKQDATFKVAVGGIPGSIIFESENFPNHFLVNEDGNLVLRERPAADDPDAATFETNATFVLHPGSSDPTAYTLESAAQRGNFLRHSSYQLYLNPDDGSDLFKQDATFALVPALWDPAAVDAAETPSVETGTSDATTFPIATDTTLEQGTPYASESGNHQLVFQPDGNLVVYDKDGNFVWGLNEVTDRYAEAAKVVMQPDGNLVVSDAQDNYIWSPLTADPDASASLVLNPDGVLQLVSGDTNTVLWGSDGVAGVPATAAPEATATEVPAAPEAAATDAPTADATATPEVAATETPSADATATPDVAATGALSFTLPPARVEYSFAASESKTLPGTSTGPNTTTANPTYGWDCKNNTDDADKLGPLAIFAIADTMNCWTDGKLSAQNWPVDMGTVTASTGEEYDAFTINPPSVLPGNFMASKHAIRYHFPTQEDYIVYQVDGPSLTKVLDIPAASIVDGGYTDLADLKISEIKSPVTYLFAPANKAPAPYAELAPGVLAATLPQTGLTSVARFVLDVDGTPFDTALDFNFGPNTWDNVYDHKREFFPVTLANDVIGVIWQDQQDLSLKLTTLGSDLKSQTTIDLPNTRNELLAAATSDGDATLYYLTIQDGGEKENVPRTAALYKVDSAGSLIKEQALDTSPTPPMGPAVDSVDISYYRKWPAAMVVSDGKIGIMLGRRLNRREDGFQHQDGVALVFSADDLSLVKKLGMTSGHSWGNHLIVNGEGDFLGVDLGDDFPRGVNLSTFDETSLLKKLVYNARTAREGIAGENSNRTFTEIGGVVESDAGYTVLFATEVDANGKTLQPAGSAEYLVHPRNVALVQVTKDYIANDNFVLSQGAVEEGRFKDFLGRWQTQKNQGIVWLTDYSDKNLENASRVKVAPLSDGNILVLWEKWTPTNYVNTYAMKVSPSGEKLSEAIELGTQVRLGRREDALVVGNRILLFAGEKTDGRVIVTVIEP